MNWLALSILSGVFAALNGLFAKLTTTATTKGLAERLSLLIGLQSEGWIVEGVVRMIFFGLNVAFNAVMWGLFTAALARGSSATKVSIINTSSNFMITAVLGSLVFSEKLPGLWWIGAGLLVAGNVIIGARDKDEEKSVNARTGYVAVSQSDVAGELGGEELEGTVGAMGSANSSGSESDSTAGGRRRGGGAS